MTSARLSCIFLAASRVLLLPQAGPHAARAITVFPTSAYLTVTSPLFRVLMLRRLRSPLPVAPRTCACRSRLDPLRDHRADCNPECYGLALLLGSQQTVNAVIVSPVTTAGDAQPGADVHPSRAVDGAARRKRNQTYPELVRTRRCRTHTFCVRYECDPSAPAAYVEPAA